MTGGNVFSKREGFSELQRPHCQDPTAQSTVRQVAWGTACVTLFCVISMAAIDRPLTLFLKVHIRGAVGEFFNGVTCLGLAGLYLIPAALLLGCLIFRARRALLPKERERWRRLAWLPGYLILSMACSGILQFLLKFLVGRYRPEVLFVKGFYGFHPLSLKWATNSFPSGHCQAVWAAMVALFIVLPRYLPLWMVVALLVSASRVLIGAHYLSDVVAGAWIGLVGSVLVAESLRKRGIRLVYDGPLAPLTILRTVLSRPGAKTLESS